MKHYDAIIVGSGQSGTPLATKLASAGFNTALVERRWVGGTCVNDGCTPTKVMIASAKLAYQIRKSAELGIEAAGIKVNLSAIVDRQQRIVKSFREGAEKQLRTAKNLNLIYGEASFIGQKQLQIIGNDGEHQQASADLIFIDTGTRPNIPDIAGLNEIPFLTSSSILAMKEIPEHLLIVGSGYVGLELAQMYSRFGSKVTLLERFARILKKEDSDFSSEIEKMFRAENIDIKLQSQASRFSATKTGIEAVVLKDNEETHISCSHVLIATGRTPNTEGLNLSATGIATDKKGFIQVNAKLETETKGIYALGEVNGGPAFTHISYNDFVIVYQNIVHDENRTTVDRMIPFCMFTDPQFARIGLSEQEAKDKGIDFKVAKLPMAHVARAIETGDTRGAMKAIVNVRDKKILGAAVLGPEGGEIMTVLEMAMMGNIPYDKISEAIFAHPTFAESLNKLFASIDD